MSRLVPIGSAVQLGNELGIVRDYMDKEGLPHVAVIEMLDPVTPDRKWQCVDTRRFLATEVKPS